jgi:hypothetical protein
MAGATALTPDFVRSPNNAIGDGIEQNDKQYLSVFPFLAPPHPGREGTPAPRLR